MPKPQDWTRLKRYGLFGSLAALGVLLFGLIGLALFFEPALAGVESNARGMYQGELGWLVMGLVLTAAGIGFLFISQSWPAELRKIVLHRLPVRMMFKLEVEQDGDSTTYFAVIDTRSPVDGKILAWRAHLWIYPPQLQEDLGRQFACDVFLHPKTGLPAAIEYSKGVLWVMSGNGAVKRLPEHGSLEG